MNRHLRDECLFHWGVEREYFSLHLNGQIDVELRAPRLEVLHNVEVRQEIRHYSPGICSSAATAELCRYRVTLRAEKVVIPELLVRKHPADCHEVFVRFS